MKQQTAVGWLIMQLPVKIRVELYEKNIHEQALQMEKEQIMDSYLDGRAHQESGKDSEWYSLTSEDYYNKTYGKPI